MKISGRRGRTRQREERQGPKGATEIAGTCRSKQHQKGSASTISVAGCSRAFLDSAFSKIPQQQSTPAHPTMPCIWPWWLGPRSRPELGGCRQGGRGGSGGLGGRSSTLRGPHSGLVEPLCQVLLILSNILLKAIGPMPHEATEEGGRGWRGKGIGIKCSPE